jgi:hypothetical protein
MISFVVIVIVALHAQIIQITKRHHNMPEAAR